MAADSPSFKWRAQVTRSSKDVQSTLQSQIEAKNASILEYILNVETPRLKSVYTTPTDGTRPEPSFFDKAPPADIIQFFQSFTAANNKQPPPTKARIKKFDLAKPKQTLNRVQKQKAEKSAKTTSQELYSSLEESAERRLLVGLYQPVVIHTLRCLASSQFLCYFQTTRGSQALENIRCQMGSNLSQSKKYPA
ncbi:hypothetical protein BOTCAL_0096g00070 [Botryotinia calthae]|uniref:Uncharacterized protein n=1 Tax=Botryotinia calthae TaxID=38488 RepID=A0A4Y8D8W0_9HELO|nr:hypothetical protein BOTCAL_0096g00070 [Botryotinia calthae]